MREMPGGQWVAFEGYDTLHECSADSPSPSRPAPRRQQARQPFPENGRKTREAVVRTVRAAIANRMVVRIVYESRYHGYREITTRDIEPLREYAGKVEAYCRLRQDIRHFRLDRIRSVAFTGETFIPRPVPATNWKSQGFSKQSDYRHAATPQTSPVGCFWLVIIAILLAIMLA